MTENIRKLPVTGILRIAPNDSARIVINGLVEPGMAGQTITTYANIINSSAIDTNLTNNGTSVNVTILTITKPDNPIANNTATCHGSPASLSASGSGTMYWFASADDTNPLDTGAIYITNSLISNTTFYVEANNGCPSNGRTPVQVTVNPVYNLTEEFSICSGEDFTFPDGTTQNNITSTVIHTSTLNTTDGCDSIITTTVNVNQVYNVSENVTICRGSSYTFPDGTTKTNITSSVTYVSNLNSQSGCDSIISTTVDVITVDISVVQEGSTLEASLNVAEYQWINVDDGNSIIPDETNQIFNATDNGNYAVIISDNGCVDTSAYYNVSILAVDRNNFSSSVRAFPNPTSGRITLDLNDFYSNITVDVLNIRGIIVRQETYNSVDRLLEMSIDELGSGVYFIRVSTNDKSALIRIVKE